jgi:hypothetical protein
VSGDEEPVWQPLRWEWEIRDARGELVRPVETMLDWRGRSAEAIAADHVALLLARTDPARWPEMKGWSVWVWSDGAGAVERLADWPLPKPAPRRRHRRQAA